MSQQVVNTDLQLTHFPVYCTNAQDYILYVVSLKTVTGCYFKEYRALWPVVDNVVDRHDTLC